MLCSETVVIDEINFPYEYLAIMSFNVVNLLYKLRFEMSQTKEHCYDGRINRSFITRCLIVFLDLSF